MGEGSISFPANIPSVPKLTTEESFPSINNPVIGFPTYFTSKILPNLKRLIDLFCGGQIKYFISQWEGLTSDKSILQTVKGEVIEFNGDPQTCSIYPTNSISKDHEIKIDDEISKLLAKHVIVKTSHEPGEFISPIFSVPKKDDNVRLILNLKKFNEHVKSHHFKMDAINTAFPQRNVGSRPSISRMRIILLVYIRTIKSS